MEANLRIVAHCAGTWLWYTRSAKKPSFHFIPSVLVQHWSEIPNQCFPNLSFVDVKVAGSARIIRPALISAACFLDTDMLSRCPVETKAQFSFDSTFDQTLLAGISNMSPIPWPYCKIRGVADKFQDFRTKNLFFLLSHISRQCPSHPGLLLAKHKTKHNTNTFK